MRPSGTRRSKLIIRLRCYRSSAEPSVKPHSAVGPQPALVQLRLEEAYSVNDMSGGAAQGLNVGGAMSPGAATPSPAGSAGMMYPASQMMSGGLGPTPMAGSTPQMQAYSQYLSQALPSINNGIRAGTIQPGQQLQNFQGPQAFGLPANFSFGNAGAGGGGMSPATPSPGTMMPSASPMGGAASSGGGGFFGK